MAYSTKSSNLLFSLLLVVTLIDFSKAMFPLNRRLTRSLPSVSDDHYQESASDGSYRYAYTGENRYTAERRLADGTVEGETLHIRPDGVPIKVHYYADRLGYRPKTEVLYEERILVPEPPRRAKVLVSDVVYKPDPPPALYLAPPPPAPERVVEVPVPVPVAVPYAVPKSDDSSTNLRIEGSNINVGNTNGGETAIANPSVTAIVGPGGRAELRPEGFASTRSGGVAISNPSTSAVVGPGGSVVLAPTGRASTNDLGPGIATVRTYSNQNAHHVFVPEVAAVRTVVPVPPPPQVSAVHTSGVVIVPPNPSYSYEYSYSAPDNQNPARDNKAYVAVRVNS